MIDYSHLVAFFIGEVYGALVFLLMLAVAAALGATPKASKRP